MTEAPRDRASRWIAAVLRARFAVLALYGLLVPVAALVALRIPNEGAIERLIVPGDPDYVATRAFQRIFPEPPLVLLVFEAHDPWSADALARVQRAREALAAIPHVSTFWIGALKELAGSIAFDSRSMTPPSIPFALRVKLKPSSTSPKSRMSVPASASSVTVASPRARRARIARRVGSASAANVLSS